MFPRRCAPIHDRYDPIAELLLDPLHLDCKKRPVFISPLPKVHPLKSSPLCVPADVRRRIRSYNRDEEEIVDIPKLQSVNKMPPNWKRHHQETLKAQLTFDTFRVRANSMQYSIVSSLLDPTSIKSVVQIVNPTLWDKFEQKRKAMIKSKSDDATALSDIGLSRKDMKDVLQYAKDFPLHPKVASVPYNDNMNLLFHCTSNKKNIDSILSTGLDERMCSGGLLGRGIYFTDNPRKSMTYDRCGVIFICGVLLGDCLSMGNKRDVDLVREPAKGDVQRRNFNDLFFDSIVGRPAVTDNEFVLYDRNQCIPLYMVEYENPSRLDVLHSVQSFDSREYVQARKDLPPFCWKAGERSVPMPSLTRMKKRDWPFYSNKIFEKMEMSG
ncbi:uncharacterized protein LOC119069739 [Bradysia coprophila]|uniref:uncharacterized protein LOC119069739 n=1 Tax=Bradysia coprophila TaxID=38358 RepID=UPI00187D70AF|nr:uncharacterized protein LOC119069739 [Bradysia coprophila]